jgi:hypothetical protein
MAITHDYFSQARFPVPIPANFPQADFWTDSQNCSQVPSERTQLAE